MAPTESPEISDIGKTWFMPSLRWLAVLLAQLSLVWMVLAGVELLLLALLPNTTLQTRLLPVPLQSALVYRELSGLALAVVLIATPILLISRLLQPKHVAVKWATRLILLAVVAAVLFVYASSWSAFRSTESFLNMDSAIFFATNNIQLLQHVAHMEPYLIVGIPILVFAAAVLAVWSLPKLERLNWRTLLAVNLAAFVGLIISLAGKGLDSTSLPNSILPVFDPKAGMVYTLNDLFAECRDERTGPVMHAWADLRSRYFSGEEPLIVNNDIAIIRRPIISMEQYLAGVDRVKVRRLSVIIVIVESLRTDQLRAAGSGRDVMPNVEKLAREGRVFINHYSQASHSNYSDLCPFSSHYPLRSPRTHIYPKNPSYPRVMIYDILKAMGYRTAVISSQNENWGKMINYLQTGNIDHFFHSETFAGPTYVPHRDTGFEAFVKGQKRSGKIDDRYTVAEAIRWIETVGQQPFFIYMNLQNSHVPYETPADFPRRFGPEKLPFNLKFNSFPPEKAPLVKEVYANSLAYVDYQLGKLIDHLKRSGKWNRTIVLVTGDTGQAFYEHGFAAHANKIFDEAMRVPLVIRAPELGHYIDEQLAQHIDLPPTILDLLHLPPHPSFQGISLLQPAPSKRSIYLMAQSPLAHQYAVIQSDFKYLYDANRKTALLFNLPSDPGERQNYIKQYPDVASSLSARLNTWRKVQIGYYQNVSQHMKWYPPILED